MLTNQADQLIVRQAVGRGALRVDPDVERIGIADGIGKLNFTLTGELGSDDVLGDVPGHVGGGTIHLGGIFAAESTAAVPATAAVSIHNDFPSGQTAISVWPAHQKAARRIDVTQDGVIADIRHATWTDQLGLASDQVGILFAQSRQDQLVD